MIKVLMFRNGQWSIDMRSHNEQFTPWGRVRPQGQFVTDVHINCNVEGEEHLFAREYHICMEDGRDGMLVTCPTYGDLLALLDMLKPYVIISWREGKEDE
jgi:hypothetical protein